MYNLLYNSFINTSSLSKLQLRSAEVILFIALQAVPHSLPYSYQSFPSLTAPYLLWFYTATFYNVFPCCNYWASRALVCRMPYENKLNFCFFCVCDFIFYFLPFLATGKTIHLFEERGVAKAPALGQNSSSLKEMTLCSKAERSKYFFKHFPWHMEIKVRNKIVLYIFPFSLCHFIKASRFKKNVLVINQGQNFGEASESSVIFQRHFYLAHIPQICVTFLCMGIY